jgi:DNA recombination protein RmuC
MIILYILSSLAVILLLAILFFLWKPKGLDFEKLILPLHDLLQKNDIYLKEQTKELKNEFSTNRLEANQNAKDIRTEIFGQFTAFAKTIGDSVSNTSLLQEQQLKSFSDTLLRLSETNQAQLNAINENLEKKLAAFSAAIEIANKDNRKELKENLELFKTELNASLKDFADRQRQNFNDLQNNQKNLNDLSSGKLNEMSAMIEKSIHSMQEGNEKKLEEMRRTVDEKLEKTLETRLNESFKLVSERLESVHKGLGEMQQLATGVGDLKKVLNNVKTRGILGEIQLGNILEQLLAPEQYEVNVVTKKGTANRVEFAIKIPQQNQENKVLLMPVDSKFPIESYYSLISAYEANDTAAIDSAGKQLESAIKKSAKDIHEKYICPPDTSEIGLMFLPIEGLYAEAVRRPSLMEYLQREYQIIVTGPTTLSAILNTISFGYKTMAMEQRSGEIKKTLSAVKTEFNTFGDVLKKAQEKIIKASEDIDNLVGTRTRKIQSKLKSFDELAINEAKQMIGSESEPKEEQDAF